MRETLKTTGQSHKGTPIRLDPPLLPAPDDATVDALAAYVGVDRELALSASSGGRNRSSMSERLHTVFSPRHGEVERQTTGAGGRDRSGDYGGDKPDLNDRWH